MPLLQFDPILKERPWGGRRLGTFLGKRLSGTGSVGESWEVSDHGADQSHVRSGKFAGWSLQRLVAEQGPNLFGSGRIHAQFPLLIKYLDAAERLSVQVHPSDAQAARFQPGERGKTEAWVILAADPGSELYAGLRRDVSRADLERAIVDGKVSDCLHQRRVAAGDCFFIPAGTVHAVGAGIVLAEVQQTSDLTFRLFDWHRVGPDGQPRALHIAQSLECIDFTRGPIEPATPRLIAGENHPVEELVRCEYFSLRRHRSDAPFDLPADRRFHVWMILAGTATFECDGESIDAAAGTTLLQPADAGATRVTPRGEVTLLEAFEP